MPYSRDGQGGSKVGSCPFHHPLVCRKLRSHWSRDYLVIASLVLGSRVIRPFSANVFSLCTGGTRGQRCRVYGIRGGLAGGSEPWKSCARADADARLMNESCARVPFHGRRRPSCPVALRLRDTIDSADVP